ncbi:MAG: MmgE/PrpD family protein [Anaerolineae bacterium]|nr:MmgE/PrpD family protein [Anaerolineae bacterium]
MSHAGPTDSISRTMAQFAATLRFEDLPAAAVHEAKRFLLDSVGCAFGALGSADVQIAHRYIENLGGTPEATVIGSGLRTNAVNAALMNSLLVRALDYNDIYWKQDPSHPSDIIPAGLACAEKAGKGGRDALLAVVIGHELEMRWCLAASPGVREMGWHHATLTQFVSPLVAGRMLDLTVDQMVSAVGISGSSHNTFGCVVAGHLTNMKNAADPLAVQAGVIAAELAKLGCTGPALVIEGREGLFDTIRNVAWQAEALTDDLGEQFLITRCSYKAYPTEYLTHSPISATIHLCQEHDLAPEDVAEITVKTLKRGAEILSDPDKYNPTTRETADHSLPYCIAVAVIDRSVLPTAFSEARLKDPRIWALLPKIRVVAEPAFEKLFPKVQPAEVTIKATDGRALTRRVDYAKGDPLDPMSDDELIAKFRSQAGLWLDAARQDAIIEATWALERTDDIGDYMRLLAT